MGRSASADGQFFPAARQGEAMNTINARYDNDPGIKAYTHVNDRFAPFASRTIPATVSEAPYLLDGPTMNEAGRRIDKQYADTGGFPEIWKAHVCNQVTHTLIVHTLQRHKKQHIK